MSSHLFEKMSVKFSRGENKYEFSLLLNEMREMAECKITSFLLIDQNDFTS